jgi:hypothetical protein
MSPKATTPDPRRSRARRPARADAFLLDTQRRRARTFATIGAVVVSSARMLRAAIAATRRDSLWISFDADLTRTLLREASPEPWGPGRAILLHPLEPSLLVTAECRFERVATGDPQAFLPPDELTEVLRAENRRDLFVGGSVDPATRTLVLWRGDLSALAVPFAAFARSGDGTEPDFARFAVRDFGHTVRLGDYEAAGDALLYEFDADYRRRIGALRRATEQSFGASLRRLRKQRGLSREDFSPHVAAKTIARIERGEQSKQAVRPATLAKIAKRLGVAPDEIESY